MAQWPSRCATRSRLRTLNLSGNEANIRESQDENDEAYAVEQGRLEAELTSLREAEAMSSTQG